MIEWNNTDPRNTLIDRNRAEIIIVKPSHSSSLFPDISLGYCEMEHSWYIQTDFYGYETIDEWPKDWYWTLFNNPYTEAAKELKEKDK
jgi:hypothetical protein